MSDLVALQIFERIGEDSYRLAGHIKSTSHPDLAEHIYTQLARHVVCRELSLIERDSIITNVDLERILEKTRPATTLSAVAIHQYAMNLKRWLLFAGHLEERGTLLYRPVLKGAQAGVIKGSRNRSIKFLAASGPGALIGLLDELWKYQPSGLAEADLRKRGMRNAIYDAVALQLVNRSEDRMVSLARHLREPGEFEAIITREVLRQETVLVIAAALRISMKASTAELGENLNTELKMNWKPSSSLRYANGLRRYYEWASKTNSRGAKS
jgi:hypothetical protein